MPTMEVRRELLDTVREFADAFAVTPEEYGRLEPFTMATAITIFRVAGATERQATILAGVLGIGSMVMLEEWDRRLAAAEATPVQKETP